MRAEDDERRISVVDEGVMLSTIQARSAIMRHAVECPPGMPSSLPDAVPLPPIARLFHAAVFVTPSLYV
jgi:hypothetical protein